MRLFTLLFIVLSGFFFSTSSLANQTKNEPTKKEQIQIIQVNINTASAAELTKILTGVGDNKAQKIIEYRDKYGPFISIEQLKEVSGIGQSILDKNAEKIVL